MVLKPHCMHQIQKSCFRSLQTYMVLKLLTCRAIVENVLDPYKLTWFSNVLCIIILCILVLDPYKLTWFSNTSGQTHSSGAFQILTNLHGSQTQRHFISDGNGFRSLQTYMVLKLNLTCTLDIESFRSLQTYMVLKRSSKKDPRKRSFRSLQTYMVLKPQI